MKYVIITLTIIIIYRLFSTFVKRQIIVKGVSNNTIYFGQTINLKNKLSHSFSDGFVVAFNTINKAGGIHNKSINLLVYDDDYSVKKAIQNARLLVDYQNVLGLIGTWGSPTTIGIMNNVIQDKNVPIIAPYTGTNILYDNFDKRIIITRDSYKNEINTIVKHATSNGKMNMGVIYQNDDYGVSCFSDLTDCILDNKYKLEIVASGSYERNSRFYYNGLKSLFGVEPYDFDKFKGSSRFNEIDSVLLICTIYQKNKLIEYFKFIKPEIYVYTLSLAGDIPFKLKNKVNMDNVYYTDVLPYVKTAYPKAYKEVQNEILEFNKTIQNDKNKVEFNHYLFEGWIAGKMIGDALNKLGPNSINRDTFIDIFYKIKNFKINDYSIGPYIYDKNNVGVKSIYLYKYNIKNKKYAIVKKYKSHY
jgi:ABC-type branched-subunit amino acid transport system substrate-binding protein